METTELTLRLPKEHLEIAERYARANRTTVAELVDRHLASLARSPEEIHPEVRRVSGLLPPMGDERERYLDHLEQKHR